MDGEITIGTSLSTDKFDKQIVQLEKKMQKEEDKKIIIETKLTGQKQELDNARQKTDALADAYQRLKQVQDKIATGKATPQQFALFQDLQATYGSLEQLSGSFDKALTKQEAIEQKVAQTKYRYDELNKKVQEYKQKIESIKIQKQVAEVDRMKDSFKNVGSSIQSTVSKVSRLALGIFGLRSAYMALRRVSSDLASYDQQYATNLEYIRYVLTQAIAPVLRWIVDLAAKLLGYINAIMQAWFGINLFSRGSAESFNKMKAGASGASKAVKEIKKQLLGFDEINMLTDQSDTGTSAGAGGVGMPDFDLSAMQGEPPEWLKWIIDNKDLILSVIGGITAGLLAWKLGLGGIKSLGIGILVSGILLTIQNIIDYLNDPSWENFGKVIEGIGTALLGAGVAFGAWPVAVGGAVTIAMGYFVEHWEQIKRETQEGINWLHKKAEEINKDGNILGGSLVESAADTGQAILDQTDNTFSTGKTFFDTFLHFFQNVFSGNWEGAWEDIQTMAELSWEFIKTSAGIFVEWLYNMTIKPILTFFGWAWDGIKEGAQGAWEGITGIFGRIGAWFGRVIDNIIKNFKYLGQRAGEVVSGAFKAVVNGVLRTIESVINAPIRAINTLIGVINNIPGINIGRLRTFSLPRMKAGGILNVPNKGTLVGGGSAIAGEGGHEGYIPLDDKQAMSTLGAEIGKNVVVNITNITEMNGRVIGRELKQVQNEQNFAYNT